MTSSPALVAPERKSSRLTRSSKLLKVIIQAIHDKKGEHLISMDLRKIPEAVADFFIVCEAGSTTQVRAIGEYIRDAVKKECGEIAFHDEGYGANQWVIVDFVNVVVHVFLPETRKFYRLEELWSDAPVQEHVEDAPKPLRQKKVKP